MIKVIMITMTGRKVDLFPESFTFQDVFNEFHEDLICKAVYLDGKLILEEELCNSLREYCRGDTMRIAVRIMPEKVEEPDPYVVISSPEEDISRSIFDEIIEMRDRLNGLISKLEVHHSECEVPF